MYSTAEILLLDDCLSAVDAHTARHIVNYCLGGDLVHNRRTVILVTHQVHLCLPLSSYFVLMNSDGIASQSGKTFQTGTEAWAPPMKCDSDRQEAHLEQNTVTETSSGAIAQDKALIKDEETEAGNVKRKVYSTYFKAWGGWLFATALVVIFVISRAVLFAERW